MLTRLMRTERAGRCSGVARAAGEDPAGSAPSHAGYLLVEVPLPWPSEFLQAARLPEGLAAACSTRRTRRLDVRPLAIAPREPAATPGLTRVIDLRRPEGAFATYTRREFLLPTERVAALAEALLDDRDLGPFAAHRVPGAARDLLVCTHGSEDACCGLEGGRLFDLARREHGDVPGLRVWRASHFGGHRFAPTLIDMPAGDCWAHVDAAALRTIVRRDAPPATVRARHRGWGGLGFFEQLVAREALVREGWAWVGWRKAGSALAVDPPDGSLANPVFTDRPVRRVRVRVTFASDGGERGAYEGTVELTGSADGLGACGASGWRRNAYRVVDLRRTAGLVPVEAALCAAGTRAGER